MVLFTLGRNFAIINGGEDPVQHKIKNIIVLQDNTALLDVNGYPLPYGNMDNIEAQTLLPFNPPLDGVLCASGKIIVYY